MVKPTSVATGWLLATIPPPAITAERLRFIIMVLDYTPERPYKIIVIPGLTRNDDGGRNDEIWDTHEFETSINLWVS